MSKTRKADFNNLVSMKTGKAKIELPKTYKRIDINGKEENLPKEGEYDVMFKTRHYSDQFNYIPSKNKKYWLDTVSWYLQPIADKEPIDQKEKTGNDLINTSMYLNRNGYGQGFNFTFTSVIEIMADFVIAMQKHEAYIKDRLLSSSRHQENDQPGKTAQIEKFKVVCTSNILSCSHKGDETCSKCIYNEVSIHSNEMPFDETGKQNPNGYFVKKSPEEWIRINGMRIINESGLSDADRVHAGFMLMPEIYKAMEEYVQQAIEVSDEEIEKYANDIEDFNGDNGLTQLELTERIIGRDEGAKWYRDQIKGK